MQHCVALIITTVCATGFAQLPATRPTTLPANATMLAEKGRSTGEAPPPITNVKLNPADEDEVRSLVKEVVSLYTKPKYNEYVQIREQRGLPAYPNPREHWEKNFIAAGRLQMHWESAYTIPVVLDGKKLDGWQPLGKLQFQDRSEASNFRALATPNRFEKSATFCLPVTFFAEGLNNVGKDPTMLCFHAVRERDAAQWRIISVGVYCNVPFVFISEKMFLPPPTHAVFVPAATRPN